MIYMQINRPPLKLKPTIEMKAPQLEQCLERLKKSEEPDWEDEPITEPRPDLYPRSNGKVRNDE